jgi:hypothetical protein
MPAVLPYWQEQQDEDQFNKRKKIELYKHGFFLLLTDFVFLW